MGWPQLPYWPWNEQWKEQARTIPCSEKVVPGSVFDQFASGTCLWDLPQGQADQYYHTSQRNAEWIVKEGESLSNASRMV